MYIIKVCYVVKYCNSEYGCQNLYIKKDKCSLIKTFPEHYSQNNIFPQLCNCHPFGLLHVTKGPFRPIGPFQSLIFL